MLKLGNSNLGVGIVVGLAPLTLSYEFLRINMQQYAIHTKKQVLLHQLTTVCELGLQAMHHTHPALLLVTTPNAAPSLECKVDNPFEPPTTRYLPSSKYWTAHGS